MTNKQPEALRLADYLDAIVVVPQTGLIVSDAAAELRRLEHNNEVLTNALWKACGDNEQVVKDTIESQGELQ